MVRLRTRLRSYAWIALVAMAALAFGPSVSRALGIDMAAAGAMPAHCMSAGSAADMAIASAGDGQGRTPDAPSPAHHSSNLLDCCALCAIAASPMAIVSFALPEWQPIDATAPVVGGDSGATTRQRTPWPSAPPRAPPFLS